jgi:hypothetical protein
MDDIVGWHYDRKGSFSVKSAYKVHRDVEGRRTNGAVGGSAGSSERATGFWTKLWNLECPPNIKHFLWRLSHNTVAVRKSSTKTRNEN